MNEILSRYEPHMFLHGAKRKLQGYNFQNLSQEELSCEGKRGLHAVEIASQGVLTTKETAINRHLLLISLCKEHG